jgi:cell fate regulator YaaT (PSP1 superfamily)
MHWIVRHGVMRFLGDFEPGEGVACGRGSRVLARTERGLEVGDVLCEVTPQAMAMITEPTHGQIVRLLTPEDQVAADGLREKERKEFEACTRFVQQKQLQMALVDVEHLFGGERIVFYFLSEKRVDFRELVKDLAREFQTRIEMRQIGVRDEAKLLADYGDCGKPVCCNTHMTTMPPVSMRMAKLQKSPVEDFRPLWPFEMLFTIRARCIRRISKAVARSRRSHPYPQRPGSGAGSGNPGSPSAGGMRGRTTDYRRGR